METQQSGSDLKQLEARLSDLEKTYARLINEKSLEITRLKHQLDNFTTSIVHMRDSINEIKKNTGDTLIDINKKTASIEKRFTALSRALNAISQDEEDQAKKFPSYGARPAVRTGAFFGAKTSDNTDYKKIFGGGVKYGTGFAARPCLEPDSM